MAVSKHNLWKRKKNGLMKLVRSHSDWLQKRREAKTRVVNTEKSNQWWEKKSTTEKPIVKTKPLTGSKFGEWPTLPKLRGKK